MTGDHHNGRDWIHFLRWSTRDCEPLRAHIQVEDKGSSGAHRYMSQDICI